MAYSVLPSNSVILIVDGSDQGRDELKKNLGQLGYRYIIEAKNTAEALAKIEIGANTGTPITLILCDWKTASVKGLDPLEKIRSSPFSVGKPVIMISSNDDLPRMLTLASAHIDGYIIKPHTHESLKLNLEAVLSGVKL